MPAFVPGPALPTAKRGRESSPRFFACAPRPSWERSRRAVLRDALIAAAAFGVKPFAALAAVDFDIDRFGDKGACERVLDREEDAFCYHCIC